jgi:hypothetical protein
MMYCNADDHRCAEFARIGQPCFDSAGNGKCINGYCPTAKPGAQSICRPLKTLGSTCAAVEECIDSYYNGCVGGVCTALPLAPCP